MNFIDVVFFQAEIAPEKVAFVAQGSVLSYGRLAHGIVSAQRRLAAAGLAEGQTVAVNVAHPIDHFVFLCAIYRLKIASASVTGQVELYLDNVKFDAVLSDSVNSLFSVKQPAARLLLVEPSWFKDQVTFSVAERTRSMRDPDPDWVCRVTCLADGSPSPTVVATTARALEAQLTTYCLAVLPNWERMISVVTLNTLTGFLFGVTALWLGRTVCLAEPMIARNVIAAYKHHYLIAAAQDANQLSTLQAAQFIAMPALRGAHLVGQRFSPAGVTRWLETISSNTVLSYVHPAIGIVAYGLAARFREVAGAVGFVAPWVEVQVVNPEGVVMPAEREGDLRFRDRGDQTGRSLDQAHDAPWIYPGQRARLLRNRLLAVF
jgi:hypothetical protein